MSSPIGARTRPTAGRRRALPGRNGRTAGPIESRRGKSGGYLLAVSPEEITLRQVVEAVDPSLLQCSVSAEGESGGGVRQAWTGVSQALSHALDGTTIAAIAQQSGGPMFYI